MSRRYHKKSRHGCLQCKRRHIKCDESHPSCKPCTTADIKCSFLEKAGLATPAASAPPSTPSALSASSPPPPPHRRHSIMSPPPSLNVVTMQRPYDNDPYNLDLSHLFLYNNLTTPEFASVGDLRQNEMVPMSVYATLAMSTPFLMHQILAMSAIHLSTRTGRTRGFYRNYAAGLQNHALGLLRQSNPTMAVTPANYAQMILFSSAVAVQSFCDTLHYHRASLDHFLSRFVQSMAVGRGVRVIINQCRGMLTKTEIGSGYKMNEVVWHGTASSDGLECAPLWDMLVECHVAVSDMPAYTKTITSLQQMFDAQPRPLGKNPRMAVLLVWLIGAPVEYGVLLNQQQPAALVVLAYFGVLLHLGRNAWMTGDSGRWLIEGILNHKAVAEEKWQKYLAFPRTQLSPSSSSLSPIAAAAATSPTSHKKSGSHATQSSLATPHPHPPQEDDERGPPATRRAGRKITRAMRGR